jgi:hypothetical protein
LLEKPNRDQKSGNKAGAQNTSGLVAAFAKL